MDFSRSSGPYRIFLVPHSHLDVEWYWTYEKTRVWSRAIFRGAIDLLKEHPEETFAQDQTPLLELFAGECSVDEKALIAQWLASGRFDILGGYVQPEVAEPDGECLIRQLVIGRRRARELFGVAPTVGWFIDTFGQVPQIPQILVGCGMDSYVFMRGVPKRMGAVPTAFWCEAPDGTRILTYWMASCYTTFDYMVGGSLTEETSQASSPLLMIGWGADVTNPADAPGAAGREMFLAAAKDSGTPVESVEVSTPSQFFRALRDNSADLPVVREDFAPAEDRFGDLRGTYSNRAKHKIANRRAETALKTAESWDALTSAIGATSHSSEINSLWLRLLFTQFHDTMGGSCTDHVYEKALRRCNTVIDLAEDISDKALDALARTVDTAAFQYPMLVFNATSAPRTDIAEYEMVFREEPANFRVVDSEGRPVPFHVRNQHGSKLPTKGEIATAQVSWLAEDVPAFGYRLFRLGRIEGRLQVNQPTETHRPIENEWFRIDVDPATGDIEKIVDVRSGYQYLAGPGNEIAARHETEPNLEGMVNITGEDETTGSNVSPTALAWESTELYERVTSTRDFLGCTVVREVTLYRGIARVHCRTTFKQFAGGDVLVSVRFPAALAGEGQLVYETPFAMTERDRSYHCAQTVVDIHDDRHGIALANTGSAGYFPFGNTLDLILFRSLANFPDYYGPLAAEQGDQTYEYVLIPHDGDWREGNAVAAGHAVNTPLTVHYAGRRAGQRGNAASFLSAQPDNVRITAVKRSYDGNALVLRLWESDGKPCDATININVPFAGAWNATMEETLLGPLPVSGNTICVPLRAWQIATVVVGTGAGVQTA